MTWLENRDSIYTYGRLPKNNRAPRFAYWFEEDQIWLHLHGFTLEYGSEWDTEYGSKWDTCCPANWIVA